MKFQKKILVLLVVMSIVPATLTGCCGSSCDKTNDEKKASPGNQDAAGQKDDPAAAQLTGPAAATYAFLSATRQGDDVTAKSMLTPKARKEISQMNLSVAPPSSDTAKFVVGEVKTISDQLAHVASRWTDIDEQGQPQSHEMTWILRHTDEGWRIGGMATVVFEDQPPLLLNFEEPQDMIRKKQLLREEIARRSGQKNR